MLNTDVHTAGPTGSWLVSPVLLMFLIFVLFSALLDFLFALKAEFLLLLNWRIKEDLRSDIFIHNSIKHKRSLQGNTCCSHTSSQFCLPQRLEEGYCWYLLCHVTYYIRMQIGVSTIYVAYLPYQEVGRILSAEHILPFPAVPLLHSGDRLQRIIPQLCILSH